MWLQTSDLRIQMPQVYSPRHRSGARPRDAADLSWACVPRRVVSAHSLLNLAWNKAFSESLEFPDADFSHDLGRVHPSRGAPTPLLRRDQRRRPCVFCRSCDWQIYGLVAAEVPFILHCLAQSLLLGSGICAERHDTSLVLS